MDCNDMRKELIDGVNGYVDDAQLIQLDLLQDHSNPNFLEEVVTNFFNQSVPEMTRRIQKHLEKDLLDFAKLYNIMTKFKGSSSSVGAKKVMDQVDQFRAFCDDKNDKGCIETFQKVKDEIETLKPKLETYLQLEKQAGAAQSPN